MLLINGLATYSLFSLKNKCCSINFNTFNNHFRRFKTQQRKLLLFLRQLGDDNHQIIDIKSSFVYKGSCFSH